MTSCSDFRSPSIFGTTIAIILAVGIAVSYVPQHVKIVQRKTAEGISTLFLLLGTTSGISAFANLTLLSSISIGCCYQGLSLFECFAGQLGVIQVGTQAICASLILVLCVYCTKNSRFQDPQQYLEILKTYHVCIVYVVVHVLLVVYTLAFAKSWLYPLANVFGILSTVLASLQYFPQIYTIYKLKHPGSLSITMMCMQTPGGFVWAVSLMLNPGAIWSSWLPYLTAAVLQGVLLLLCMYYYKRYPDKMAEDETETSTLIPANI